VDLAGDICGSLYCNSFNFSASRTNYTNHLLDAEIDFSKLPLAFSGFALNDPNPKRSLIEWLN
jgi:hypothetical protein